MKLIWLPTWRCPNYAPDGSGENPACPYCPLGFRDGHLTVHGQTQAPQDAAKLPDVLAFFDRSRAVFDEGISLSGGEPLVYPWLRPSLEHLSQTGWRWAITSNMMATGGLERLAGMDFSRCSAWTCSFHPFADKALRFSENVHRLRSFGVQWIYVTLVVTRQTVDLIRAALPILEKLPVDRFNLQFDLYHKEPPPDFDVPNNGRWLFVKETTAEAMGVDCQSRAKTLVLSPSGQVFECVNKAYIGKATLGHCSTLDPRDVMDGERRWCGLKCSLPCDVVKWIS